MTRASSLYDPVVAATLGRLHAEARGDWKHFVRIAPRFVVGRLIGRSFLRDVPPSQFKDVFIPITRDAGRLLYTLARANGAKRIVEFGTSFAISTIYLAAAARDNEGEVVSTEIEPSKVRAAEENLRQAGLDRCARVLEGDAVQTLPSVAGPVDLLFLDGWKDLYVPVLEIMLPKLRPGALVVADNTNFADCKPYLARVRGPEFSSTSLYGGRMEVSCLLPRAN